MQCLEVQDFAEMFGVDQDEFSEHTREAIQNRNFSYRVLEGRERDEHILNVLKRIEADTQVIAAPERKEAWSKGWAENLETYIKAGKDPAALTPKFLRPNQALRLRGEYILSPNPSFELDFITVFRSWFFGNYLKNFEKIYEFGSGTGFNLVCIAEQFPEKELWGMDFVQPAVDLVNAVGACRDWNIQGCLFDMLNPDPDFDLPAGTAVFTFGALEQLAGEFDPFLSFLLDKKIGICLHVEPTAELYDESTLFDWMALKFHRKRGYSEKLLPRLRELDEQGHINLENVRRLGFGSLMMEGYTYYVWRPKF